MPVTVIKHENAGHPWDGRPGFDLLELQADTADALNAAVTEAKRKFWQPWLVGTSEDGTPNGVMFKPSGITQEWHDSPENRHPGIIQKPAKETSLGM